MRWTAERAGVAVLVGALYAPNVGSALAGGGGGGVAGGAEWGWPVRRFDQGLTVISAPPAPIWQGVPGRRAVVWPPVPPGWKDAARL